MRLLCCLLIAGIFWTDLAHAAQMCRGAGPQSPRDIEFRWGRNKKAAPLAPPAASMNLCNIHVHKNAEHKGPGFGLFAG